MRSPFQPTRADGGGLIHGSHCSASLENIPASFLLKPNPLAWPGGASAWRGEKDGVGGAEHWDIMKGGLIGSGIA